MSTVAEQLRTAREAKNLTVQQVADVTKIRTDHVRALEEGDFNALLRADLHPRLGEDLRQRCSSWTSRSCWPRWTRN